MTAQPAITTWATEDNRRCIPPCIRVDELAHNFDWLKLSPESWAKMKVEGIPPHIERQLETRLYVLESFRLSQKLASLAAKESEPDTYDEEYRSDYENTSYQSMSMDHNEPTTLTSKPSLRAAIEKIESPRRTRTLISAMLDDIIVPNIDRDPIKSYRLHDDIVGLLCARSANANSISAKELVFCLLRDADNTRKDGNGDLALELEFIASAIDLIAYRSKERTAHAKRLWF